ncbi:MAG: JAB domain-containing protein [Eubacterium sp.]
MAKLSREGHRERVKQSYLDNSFESMSDHNVLELLLFYAIPRKDVKPIAYDLINRFGSLENVFNANIEELKNIDGVGENTAILISLVRDIYDRVLKNHNANVKQLKSNRSAKEYVTNLLKKKNEENVIAISLSNNLQIIHVNYIARGTVNCSMVDPKLIIECAIRDNAPVMLLAHNHPRGDAIPSNDDIELTSTVTDILRRLNVTLIDHIIVGGNETKSMRNMARFTDMFDK